MNTVSFLGSSSRWQIGLSILLAALFCGSASIVAAQSVPVPYASTAAGGGVVCANSLSTYAPLAANEKLVGDGCPAAQSTFNTAVATAIDRFNNVVIADQTNDLVRVIYNGGTAMATAITAAYAQTTTPVVPQVGYIYTLVGGPQGTPSQSTYYCTETGTGAVGFDKQLDGCPGAYAYVQPRGMAFDKDGNLFISSLASSYTVRVVYIGGTAVQNLIALENPTLVGPPQVGYVYEIAGTGALSNTTGGDGGLAYKATIGQPRGLWIDSNEDVYVADATNGLIRRIDGTTGLISTVAGSCSGTSCPASASAGDGSLAASSAVKINYAYGEVFDNNGNMFIADSGSGTSATGRIRVVYAGGTLAGITNPVVGNIYTYAGGGATSGTQAQQATFQYVEGVGIDANGYLYVDDYRNATSPGSNHIWRIDPATGNIANIAGNGGSTTQTAGSYCSNSSGTMALDNHGDGCPGPQTYLNAPQQGPAFDSLGNFYIPEHNGNILRYFYYNNTFPSTHVGSSVTQPLAFALPFGTASTKATFLIDGAAATDFTDAGNDVCVGAGSTPQETVCVTNVTFTPSAGNVREGSITATPTPAAAAPIEALVGVGSAAQLTIDPGTSVSLGSSIKPQGVSVDLLGNVYLSDGASKQVLKTTLAGGTPTAVFTGLASPRGTTTDSFGNVYVADATNNVVLQLSASGTVSTVITGMSAPSGMAADVRGNVYVADTGNNRILSYSPQSGVSEPVNAYPQTLSAPTGLAVDAAGDLYVLDSGNKRILELPPAGLPQTMTLPAGVVPAAFTLDHAGNLYLADTTADTLLLARTSGSVQTLETGLTTPVGLAIDTNGDVFLADSSSTSVFGLNRTVSTDSFATTNVNAQSLPTALYLESIGDLAATLGAPLFTEAGNSADFPATNSSTACSSSQVLASGAFCSESFLFAPTTGGARSATVTFTPAAGAPVGANLSGAGVNLISTTLTITQTAPTTTTVSYGQSTTFVANLTSTSTSPAPTGTVTFVVDGVKQTPQAISAAGNTLSNNLAVGTHIVAASYSGDSAYASSNATFSFTVNRATTAITIVSSQSVSGVNLSATVTPAYTGAISMTGTVTFYIDNASQGAQPVGNGTVTQLVSVADGTHSIYSVYSGDGDYATSTSSTASLVVNRTPTTTALTIGTTANTTTVSLTLSATVTGAGAVPGGTVTFYNGTKSLGMITLGSTASATLPVAVTSNFVYTASYSGNGLFQPSTVTVTEPPDFAILMPNSNLVVPQGGQAVQTISVVSVANYTGSMTASCSNLPANSLCRFSPVPLTVSPGVNGNLGVEVFVGISPQVASIGWPIGGNRFFCLLSLLLASASLAGLLRCRGSRPNLRLLSIVALCILAVGASACASQGTFTYITPVGTYPVTVALTDANNVTHPITLNVQINGQ